MYSGIFGDFIRGATSLLYQFEGIVEILCLTSFL